MKKFFAIILTMLIVAGLGVSAFAGTVTVNGAQGGSTQIWSGSLTGADDGEVQLYAQASEGYSFDHWEYSGGAGASSSNPETFTTFDRWVQPVFTASQTTEEETVLNESGVFENTDDTDLSNPQTTVVTPEDNTQNTTLPAALADPLLGESVLTSGTVFSDESVSLDTDKLDSGLVKAPGLGEITFDISPAGSGEVTRGEYVTISGNTALTATAVPSDSSKYEFSHWIADGLIYYDKTQYFDVTRRGEPLSRTITVVFKEKSSGSTVVPPPATVYHATKEAVPAEAAYVYVSESGNQATFGIYSIDPSYSFVRWIINGIEQPFGKRTITAELNQNLHGAAMFVKNTATTYKITYKPDNANEHYDLQPQYKNANAPAILYDGGYTRSGYVQTGWISTDWVYYPLGGFYNENADVTLFPYWEKAGKHYVTVYYNGSGGNIKTGSTLVKNGDSFLVPDDGSVTFKFNSAQGFFPSSAVLNGVSRSFSNNTFTVWGKGCDQVLKVTFASVYSPPQTGDSSSSALWTALGILSFTGLGTLTVIRKKMTRREDKG